MEDERVKYSIRKSRRARKIRITVFFSGEVVATKPWYVSDGVVKRFIADKSDWILSKVAHFKKLSEEQGERFSPEKYYEHKEEALILAIARVEHFNKAYGFTYNTIRIKNQKTRWGSCSSKGNLNFNYKILFISEEARDYIIVHELCHLKELNHSPKFWKLVAEIVPNYKELRRELRRSMLLF